MNIDWVTVVSGLCAILSGLLVGIAGMAASPRMRGYPCAPLWVRIPAVIMGGWWFVRGWSLVTGAGGLDPRHAHLDVLTSWASTLYFSGAVLVWVASMRLAPEVRARLEKRSKQKSQQLHGLLAMGDVRGAEAVAEGGAAIYDLGVAAQAKRRLAEMG